MKINVICTVIALSETWLNSRSNDISGFPDYDHICNYRDNKRGGGVSLLLNPTHQYLQIDHLTLSLDCIESIFVQIVSKQYRVVVGCVYKPPNSNMNEFIEKISYVLENLNKYKCHSYILGDFNIDLLNTHSRIY